MKGDHWSIWKYDPTVEYFQWFPNGSLTDWSKLLWPPSLHFTTHSGLTHPRNKHQLASQGRHNLCWSDHRVVWMQLMTGSQFTAAKLQKMWFEKLVKLIAPDCIYIFFCCKNQCSWVDINDCNDVILINLIALEVDLAFTKL